MRMVKGDLLRRGTGFGAALLLAAMVLVPASASAAMHTVACPGESLQAAIDSAVAGGSVEIAAGTCSENVTISKDLTLTGAGPGMTYLDGGLSGTVVTIGDAVSVELRLLTVMGGNTVSGDTNGGGVLLGTGGSLTLDQVVITENRASSNGGGIYSKSGGSITLLKSSVVGNSAGTNGGGIFSVGSGNTLMMSDSTVANNVASTDHGGGLFFTDSVVTIERSTISGNEAGDDGGGVYTAGSGTVAMTNVTVSGNTASAVPTETGFGGGVFIQNAALVTSHSTIVDNAAFRGGGVFLSGLASSSAGFRSTILTSNTATSMVAPGPDCLLLPGAGTVATTGFNIFGSTVPDDCSFGAGPGDQVGADPMLGLLQDNGGPSTHALVVGSPAIDAVTSGCPPPATDARGVVRPQGLRCDIGAYEAPPSPIPDTVGLVDVSQGIWYLRNPAGQVTSFFYGNPTDLPIAGDWDGDGDATPGLYRQSDGFFYARNSNTQGPADAACFAGNPEDIPVVGDWDGDGDDNLGIYRPSEQMFYLFTITCTGSPMGAAQIALLFGNPGDKPVAGDWDGDGIDEVGLHRESTGFFYWRNTLDTGIASDEIFFGDPGDRFVAGDWGAAMHIDGVDTPAVFRPSSLVFFFRHTLTQGVADSQFEWDGAGTGWLPVAGNFGLS